MENSITKLCRVCRDRKPITEFHIRKAYKDGYDTRCKSCELQYDRDRASKCVSITAGSKQCSFCKKTKDVSEFTKRLRSKDGLRNRCKKCDRAENTKYRVIHPSQRFFNRLYQQYKLTKEQYLDLFNTQNGKCAVCNHNEERLNIDHNHITGKVRGLLCRNCNSAIGLFEDNIQYLESAIKYIKDSH